MNIHGVIGFVRDQFMPAPEMHIKNDSTLKMSDDKFTKDLLKIAGLEHAYAIKKDNH